jgi:hypothetical protein
VANNQTAWREAHLAGTFCERKTNQTPLMAQNCLIATLFEERHSLNLTDKVNQENWPTPAARDHKGTNSPEKTLARVDAGLRGNMGQLPNAVMVNEIKNGRHPGTKTENTERLLIGR